MLASESIPKLFKMKSSSSRVVIIELKQPNDENEAGSTPGDDVQERQQPALGKYTRNKNAVINIIRCKKYTFIFLHNEN